MRYPLYLSLALGGLLLTACSKSEKEAPVSPPPAQNNTAALVPSPAATTPPAPAPSIPPPSSGPGNVAAAAPTVPTEAMNGEVYGKDEHGIALKSEEIIRKAIMQHVEGKGHPYPSRIEELVEKGTLKSLPPAPDGKKWAIDPNTRKLVAI